MSCHWRQLDFRKNLLTVRPENVVGGNRHPWRPCRVEVPGWAGRKGGPAWCGENPCTLRAGTCLLLAVSQASGSKKGPGVSWVPCEQFPHLGLLPSKQSNRNCPLLPPNFCGGFSILILTMFLHPKLQPLKRLANLFFLPHFGVLIRDSTGLFP